MLLPAALTAAGVRYRVDVTPVPGLPGAVRRWLTVPATGRPFAVEIHETAAGYAVRFTPADGTTSRQPLTSGRYTLTAAVAIAAAWQNPKRPEVDTWALVWTPDLPRCTCSTRTVTRSLTPTA